MISIISVYLLSSYFQQGFIALVEHRTRITEVMGSNPIGASDVFLGFLCFTTSKITVTCNCAKPAT